MFDNYPLLKELTSKKTLDDRQKVITKALGGCDCEFDMKDNIIHSVNRVRDDRKTVIYMAHYDVVDEEISNVIDNLGSVVNLIEFALQNRENKEKNIFVVFTNYEETASFEKAGSSLIAEHIAKGLFGDVELVVNLELTSIGRFVCVNNYPKVCLDKITDCIETTTPFNDAAVLWKSNIPAICVGTLDFNNYKQVQANHYCWLWGLCHQDSDLYVKEDMEYFIKEKMPKFLAL